MDKGCGRMVAMTDGEQKRTSTSKPYVTHTTSADDKNSIISHDALDTQPSTPSQCRLLCGLCSAQAGAG